MTDHHFMSRNDYCRHFGRYSHWLMPKSYQTKPAAVLCDGIVYDSRPGEIHRDIMRREGLTGEIVEGFLV